MFTTETGIMLSERACTESRWLRYEGPPACEPAARERPVDPFKIRLAHFERPGSHQQSENVRVTFEVGTRADQLSDSDHSRVPGLRRHWRLSGEELQKLADMNLRSA